MTQNETNRVLAMLAEMYPSFRKDRNPAVMSAVWQESFRTVPGAQVESALMEYYATDPTGYPPNPGALRRILLSHMEEEELSEAEAWHLTLRAISRGIYNSGEEYERLPEPVKRVIRSPGVLHEWAMMAEWQIQNSIAPWFRRAYSSSMEKERSRKLLPGDGIFRLPGSAG